MRCALQYVCKTCSKGRVYQIMHSQKGSILVFAVFVCTALLALATSLVDLNSADLKIAANQRDSLQAYYLATTGIEIACGILAEHDPFYCGNEEIFFAGGNIKLSVSAMDQEDGCRQVQITSTGKFGIFTEQIIVQFQSVPACSGCTDGAELGWYNQESGEIIPGSHAGADAISLGSPDIFSLVLNRENNGAVFSAEQIIFKSNLIIENDLEIEARMIVFQKSVRLCPQEGSLRLLHPSGGLVHVYLREEISTFDSLLLEPGAYFFPGGLQITKDSSLPDLKRHRTLPVVPGTMFRKAGIPN